jgi:uncharacterized protein YyaL (SSP411 family)
MFRFSPRSNRAHEVRWRQWEGQAFCEAEEQHKPIVLFLTAFWCGYCQRLDETTLSNEQVIALLNAFFIPIRVEESQRPDVDLRYNQNGWPTIAFLTPAGDHLFSVNYTAPEPFINLLVKVVDAYRRDPATLCGNAERQRAAAATSRPEESPAPLGPAVVAEIAGMIEGLADATHGGYGTQFKFLHPEANDFFLYVFEVTGDTAYLDHVCLTLDTMRHSSTFDAEHGGFFRYSSKPDWHEPHPEKLLDDQAGLLRNYLHAYLLTEQPRFRDTAEGLVDYLETTLASPHQACLFGCQDYVRPELDLAALRQGPQPMVSLIDEYVYCDANAHTASAYLDAWWILGRDDCRERARHILEQLWETLRTPDGSMYHYSDGEPHVPGLLMDSVRTGLALLDAYAACGQEAYLERARHLAAAIARQHRSEAGGFCDISTTGPASLRFPVAVLAQNAHAAAFFVRLADLSGDLDYRKLAHWALKPFPNSHRQHGAFAAGFGHALGRLLALPLIVIIRGVPGTPGVRSLARAALMQLRHGDVVLQFHQDQHEQPASATLRLGEQLLGPFTDPAALSPALAQTGSSVPKPSSR